MKPGGTTGAWVIWALKGLVKVGRGGAAITPMGALAQLQVPAGMAPPGSGPRVTGPGPEPRPITL